MRHPRLAVATLLLSFAALRSSAAINGTVMTTEGQPLAGARVSVFSFETSDARHLRLLSPSPEEVPLATVMTDSKGAFSLASPKEAVVDLAVFIRGYFPVQMRVERDEEVGAISLLKSEPQQGTISTAGKPVAGATIVLNYGEYEYVTKSGEDGKYEAPDVKRARSIAVVHPSYAINEENFMVAGGRGGTLGRLNRPLVAGATLSGHVTGVDGKTGGAGIAVSLDGWPLAITTADGAFTIAHAPAKWNALSARKDSLLGQRAFSNAASQDLRLAKAATISGRILDPKTKVPIAGAVISAFLRMERGDSNTSAVTDPKGGFSILVPPGSYRVLAVHPAYDQKLSDAAAVSGQTIAKDLSLTPLARVTGVVVDEGKKPVAAAAISAENPGDPMTAMMRTMRFGAGGTAVSGPDGRFAIRFPGDDEMRLKAVRKGLPTAKSETLKLAPGERKNGVVLTIASGFAVAGKVTDRDGKPLSGVAVMTSEAEPGRGGSFQRMILTGLPQYDDDAVRTGSDGTYSLRLKEGSYDFTFKREGYATMNARAQSVRAAANNVVDATLDPAVEIRGRVVRSGNGLEGVMVAAMIPGSDSRTTTGPDGSFTLGGLTPGQVRVTIRKDDEFVQEMRNFTAPTSDVVIDLPVGSRISGRVIDKGSRKPVTQFQAGISRSRSAGGMVMMTPPQLKSFTSDDGSFTLENVPSGAQDLVASAPGFTSGRLNINVEEGKALSGLEVELDTGTRLVGKVTGPTGSPLSDVRVGLAMGPGGAIARMGMGSQNTTVTDENGEYVLEALESGDETIEFSHPKYIGAKKPVTLKGREVRLDLQLEGGQRVTGVVVTEAGVPVADVEVFANASGGSRRSALTNASGVFEFESLAPAHYRFSAEKSGYSEGRVDDFDIASGAPLRITMKAGGTIFGRVTGLAATDYANVTVDARAGGSSSSASVDSSGNYKLEGAPNGTVQVSATMMTSAMTGRRTTPVQTVQIDAGTSRQVDIEFSSDTVIRGRVTRNGAPLKGAGISFVPRTGRTQATSSGSTDDDGNYSITGIDEGEYSVNVMDMQRFAPYTTTLQVHGSATFDIDYKSNALRGRVLDAMTNAPLADVNVQLRSSETGGDGFRGTRAATTDASGSFTLEISPGSYVINAAKDGYGNQAMDLSIGDRPPDNLELKLAANDGVTLKVVDGRDGRLLDAFVSVFDAQGRLVHESRMMFGSNAEGGSETKLPLAPGPYTASVRAMGYATRWATFDSPSKQTVALTPGGTLLVRSKHSTRARVQLVSSNTFTRPSSSKLPTWDLNPSPGTTSIEHLAPGTYTLQLLGDNDAVVDTERVTITEGQTSETEI